MQESDPSHLPVLPEQICEIFRSVPGDCTVDCTLGLGGHTRLLLAGSPNLQVIGLDADPDNLSLAQNSLSKFSDRLRLVNANFRDLATVLSELKVGKIGGILADLGVSSNQIANPDRGLSFDLDGPLDMRLDRDQHPTAADLVNGLPEGELADLLYLQGGETRSRRIAKRICQARRQGRINSTVMLARLVSAAVGQDPDSRRSRIHPATKTFMALRISVNRELESLQKMLEQAPGCLLPGGRIAVISFHSGEDRVVKENFRTRSREGIYRVLTPKPLTAESDEVESNPRSRSAKLRAAELVVGT